MKTTAGQQDTVTLIKILSFCAILFNWLIGSTVLAQINISPHFEYYSVDDGLSENTIKAMLQDRHGFIWIGTGDGLNRYDGYSFKTYRHDPDDPKSLNDNVINFIFEDSEGQLWIGTQQTALSPKGPGKLHRLNRATGKFERFEHDPNDTASISSDQINSVFEDSNKNIWIGADGIGLDLYDRKTGQFKHFRYNPDVLNSLGASRAQIKLEDSGGSLWIVSGGVCRLEITTGKIERFVHDPDHPASISSNQINAIFEDSRKNLWFGTNKGLNRFDPSSKTFKRFQHDFGDPHSLSDDKVSCIYEDTQKNLWIGTHNGLDLMDRATGKFSRFQHDPGDPNTICHNVIVDIKEDLTGKLWIVTQAGLALMDPALKTFDRFFQSQRIYHLLPDNSGNIWIGLGAIGLGLDRMDLVSANIQHFECDPQDPNSLTSNAVWPILEDSDGYVWVGTDATMVGAPTESGGLDRLDRTSGKFEHFKHDLNDPTSIAKNEIFALFEDSGGYLWVGYEFDVLDRLDRKTGKVIERFFRKNRDSTSISIGPIANILEDPEGNLWFSGGNGINKLDKTTGLFEHFMPFPNAANLWGENWIESMIMDSEGYIWAGTLYKGLSRLDPRTGAFEYFEYASDNANSLSHNSVIALHEDAKKNVWVGTEYGLNRWDANTRRFIRYYEQDGFPNAFVYGIEEDDHGRLWISTNHGISRLDPEKATFRNFDRHDGLQSNKFNWYAHFKSPRTGELFFGGNNGLNIFHPDSIKIDTFAPPVTITSLTSYNRKQGKPLVDEFISEKEKIILSYRENILSFEFAALNFRKTAKNKYKYQLAGFSDQWYDLGNKREVTFTDLHPGNYTLRVMAANSDGIWSHNPTELAIKVLPPWWWALWTKVAYIVLLLGMFYAMYRLLLHRKLTLIETRQLKALDAIKSKFYTNITHEFRTPLTVIQGLSNQTIEKQGVLPPDKNLESARMIKRNSAQLLTMVNQMLDLRKLESGSLTVNLVKGNVLQYLRYLTESFYSYAADRGVGLHFMTDLDELVIDYDEDKLLHIVSNLLSNAIKFTPEGGNVYFSVDTSVAQTSNISEILEVLELRVKDTGVGISEEQLPFIFDRFYQVDQNPTRKGEGTGIGLALTRELVKLLKGEIEVKSRVEQGTTFIVSLPVSREATEAPAQQLLLKDRMLGFTAPKPFHAERSKMPDNGGEIPLALIIEDNPDVVRYLSSCLEGTYKVVTAMDGQTGVDTALDLVPDIIVSDVMMPKKDGFEVCDILKNDERTSHIPVILLTAKADRASRIKGLRTGADAYLAKPFNREELQVRLEQLIEIRKKMQERYCSLRSPVEEDMRTLEDTFLDKVKKVVLEHISDPEFGLLEICRALGLSRSQLFRKLKALTGKSTSLVVRSIRLEQAKELLQDTDLNVSEVAYEVGFKDPSFFSRLFTEEYGEPPSTFRT